MARIELSILDDRARGARVDKRWLKVKLSRVLRMMHIAPAVWTILLVGDAAMKRLHRRTMGRASTTDVLTFDLGATGDRNALELDTVLCVAVARRRARELDHPVRHELLLYAVHSLLHLRGYDDRTPALARRMHRREDEILTALGVGPVFASRAKSRGRGVTAKNSAGGAAKGNQP